MINHNRTGLMNLGVMYEMFLWGLFTGCWLLGVTLGLQRQKDFKPIDKSD